ncbi:MAG TPA: sulfotransferase family 2 domain-containing protein [Bacteroidia bacterium]|nr:sulfotransferase family 2 domain-containing protein [Bacteroidia bacterium]
MPYNKKDKLIFLHIPKTGGTSILTFFEMDKPENFCFFHWDDETQREPFLEESRKHSNSDKLIYEPQHYTIDIIKELIPDYGSYFKFSFVRNPYTRILSEYFYRNGQQLIADTEFNPDDFHNWCLTYLSVIDNSHKEPQVNFIDQTVNFIGKYESISDDIEVLKTELVNFSNDLIKYKNKPLPHLNSTPLNKSHLIKYILPETKELIYFLYKPDFNAFSYNAEI